MDCILLGIRDSVNSTIKVPALTTLLFKYTQEMIHVLPISECHGNIYVKISVKMLFKLLSTTGICHFQDYGNCS